jgi:YVTN family beta-propeller protein
MLFHVRLWLLVLALAGVSAAETEMLLVLFKGSSSLAFYTPDGKLETEAPVGRHPHEMVLTQDGRYAFVTDNGTMRIEQPGEGGNTVSVVDLRERKRVETINLGNFRRPHGIDYEARTGRVAVTTELPDRLLLIDEPTRSIRRVFETKGRTSHMVRFGPGARGAEWAYVSNSSSATVTAVNLTTGFVREIPTGQRPEGSVLARDGSRLYVANRESASITVIDTERHAAVAELKAGRGPVRIDMTPDGRYLVCALMHDKAVQILDVETHQVVATIPVEGEPVSLHLSHDGQHAVASAQEMDLVHIVSIPERKVVRTIKTPKGSGPDPAMLVKLPD